MAAAPVRHRRDADLHTARADVDSVRACLEKVFDSGDAGLLEHFRALAAAHLEVIAGNVSKPQFGVSPQIWDRLSQQVDLIVHPPQPISYLSTVSVAMTVEPGHFEEDGDIRAMSSVRPVDDSYANGYGNSKWAGEVLLREAHDLCGLPVSVFRSGMILAHPHCAGQLNVPDMFTRLVYSLLVTGLAPRSFYPTTDSGQRARSYYDGLPVDFVPESITTLGLSSSCGFRSYDVMNAHHDGVSLDLFVDWMNEAGHNINRVDDYSDWLHSFETALGALAPAQVFRHAVQQNKIGADNDIPHMSRQLIDRYVSDLHAENLLPT